MEDERLLDDSTILVQDTQNTSPDTVTRRIVNRLGLSSRLEPIMLLKLPIML